MRKILALLLLVTLCIPGAQALTLPYAADTVLSVLALTDAQRALADFLYEPVFSCREVIELPENTRYDDVSAAMSCLMLDYPELFHLGRDYTISYYRDEPEIATAVRPGYLMSAGEAAALRSSLYARSSLIVSGADPEGIHDALCAQVSYGGDPALRHTAAGALLQGQATCEGYAQALTLMYRMAGIPCGIVTGDAVDSSGRTERHSWNIARLNGFTLIDATWNDQEHLSLNTHWYYGLSTDQMGTDHFPDEGQRIPRCGEQDNWHTVRGYTVSSQAGIDAALRRLAAGETVNLRFTDWRLYQPLAYDPHECLTDYNARNPAYAFYGSYSITKSETQLCLILQPGR